MFEFISNLWVVLKIIDRCCAKICNGFTYDYHSCDIDLLTRWHHIGFPMAQYYRRWSVTCFQVSSPWSSRSTSPVKHVAMKTISMGYICAARSQRSVDLCESVILRLIRVSVDWCKSTRQRKPSGHPYRNCNQICHLRFSTDKKRYQL
jgi:hypothetical protein